MALFIATPGDVAARFRPLTAAEVGVVEQLLADLTAQAAYEVPDLEARLASGALPVELARSVIAEALIRAFRNREGAREKAAGPFRVTYESVGEVLRLTGDDLARLRVRRAGSSRVGTIRLGLPW